MMKQKMSKFHGRNGNVLVFDEDGFDRMDLVFFDITNVVLSETFQKLMELSEDLFGKKNKYLDGME